MKLNKNWSINIGARGVIKIFFHLAHQFVQEIVTLNICVKLYQNLSINKGARGVTKK